MKKGFFYKHPIIGGLITIPIIMLIFNAIGGLAGMLAAIADMSASGHAVEIANLGDALEPYLLKDMEQIVGNATVAIVALLFLLIFYLKNRKNGYRGPFKIHGQNIKDVKIFIAIFLVLDIGSGLLYLFTYPGGFPKITVTLSMIVLALYAGINEEISDRAISAAIMMRNKPTTRRVLATALLTSMLFGAGHALNLLAGQDLGSTIIQIIFTGGAGLFFAGIYLRTGSITLTIVIHILHDLMGFIIESLPEVESTSLTINDVLSLSVNVAPVIFGILMLLPKYYPEIVNTWKYIWSEKESV